MIVEVEKKWKIFEKQQLLKNKKKSRSSGVCIRAYAYHPTSLSHRVGRIHHIDRVYFEIHAPGMGLESTLLSLETLKSIWFLILISNPTKKSTVNCAHE